MSTPLRPRRRRREAPTPPRALLAGLVVAGILAIVFAVALKAPGGLPGIPYKTVYAVVPDVGNLPTHSDVRIAGKRVGQVMDVTAADGRARLKLQLDPGVDGIPADSAVMVRAQGLLGARYLQILRGESEREVDEGATLRSARESITLSVPDALQTFDALTRRGLRDALDGLGSGLLGRGPALNQALAAAPDAARHFRTVARAVTRAEAAARRLLPSLSGAAASLDDAKKETTAMFGPANRALTPFVDRRKATRATIAAAAPALEDATPAFDEGRTLLAATRHLARAAARTLPSAPAALRATGALLRDSRVPLSRLRPLLRRARTAVPATLRLTDRLYPLARPLKQPLDDLRQPVRHLGAHGCDIANFAKVWHSFLGFGIPGGESIGPLGEIRAEALVRMPFAEAGDAENVPGALVETKTYPEPCTYLSKPYDFGNPLE